MKILVTSDQYAFTVGGVATSALALCTGLREMGHEVKTLSPSNTTTSSREGDDYFIKSIPAVFYPGVRLAFSFTDPLLKELWEWNPDIIHVQSEGPTYIMARRILKRSHARLIMTCHTDYAHFAFGRLKSTKPVKVFMRTLGKIFYGKATALVAPSKKAAGFACLSPMKERITVIPNGIDLDKYCKVLSPEERESILESHGIERDDKVLVCVSRISKEKNVAEIVKAFPALLRRLPEAKLLIVGDGPDVGHIESLIQKLGLGDSVIMAGRIPHEDVWKYYASGDVFVSASTFEVHSMCYLEALAQGRPLLCRRDDSLDGVLKHGWNGLIYNSRKAFVKYAYRLLTDDRLRLKMGENSAQAIKGFSNEEFARSTEALYRRILSKKH